ncbi:unnamed protein product [Spodoptera exigua]|nr:unnamed protein product [Spodoptera exigua]
MVGKPADGLPDGKQSAPPMDTGNNSGPTTAIWGLGRIAPPVTMKTRTVVLVIILGCGAAAILFAVAAYLYIRRRRKKREDEEDGTSCAISGKSSIDFCKYRILTDLKYLVPSPAIGRGWGSSLRTPQPRLNSSPITEQEKLATQPESDLRVWLVAYAKEPIDHHKHDPTRKTAAGKLFQSLDVRGINDEAKRLVRAAGPSVRRVAFRARLKEPIDHHRRGPKGLMFSRGCGVSAMRYRDLGTEQEKEQGGF